VHEKFLKLLGHCGLLTALLWLIGKFLKKKIKFFVKFKSATKISISRTIKKNNPTTKSLPGHPKVKFYHFHLDIFYYTISLIALFYADSNID
jgi:hypothetical protein